MDWWLMFILILSLLIFLFFLSVPVAFCFLFVNVLFAYLFWGGEMGLTQLVLSIARSISSFSLLPVPLFLLMGEVMFLFGIAQNMMDALEKWMGRIPGRLSLAGGRGRGSFCHPVRFVHGGMRDAGTDPCCPRWRKRGTKPRSLSARSWDAALLPP